MIARSRGIALGLLILGLVASPLGAADSPTESSARVEYNRDVRPILSNNCFKCHGPDAKQRQAELRLDLRDEAVVAKKSGRTPIVPGKSSDSELVARVSSSDLEYVMPPPSSGKKLTAAEKALLARWIEQGAEYQAHWSFLPPRRPALPRVAAAQWPRNPIDAFILAALEADGLRPSPEADTTTLIRRLTLDLTGLPPTPAEIDAFLGDASPDAYDKLVDRLLDSPHYGERMALDWLDAARFADTHGYHIDSARDMSRWRRWVIDAFRRNTPFDQFTVEQLAGDLLPGATVEQKIASGFNRNHMINFEGGAIPEEYHNAYIVDRVNTTSTVWMGLTLACCQCHDHKYDPVTQKEYYQLYAFFHNVPENGLDGRAGNAAPVLRVPTPDQEKELESLRGKITASEETLKTFEPQLAAGQTEWEARARTEIDRYPVTDGLLAHYELDGHTADTSGHHRHAEFRDMQAAFGAGRIGAAAQFDGGGHIDAGDACGFERGDHFSYGAWIYPNTKGHMAVLARMDDAAAFRGYDLYLGDGKVFVHLVHAWPASAIRVNTREAIALKKWHHVLMTYDGTGKAAGVRIYVDGKKQELETTHDTLSDSIATPQPLHIGRRGSSAPFRGMIDEVRLYGRELTADEVERLAVTEPVRAILDIAADKRTAEQQDAVRTYYRAREAPPEFTRLETELVQLRNRQAELDTAIPTTMVMAEMDARRDTFLLERGQYDKKGEKVSPAVPAAFPPLPPDAPPNRLGLARWLVDPAHPLTARVAVNRYWQMYFGTGIVKTAEDLGTQGEWPSHPDLLDWLACEFMSPFSSAPGQGRGPAAPGSRAGEGNAHAWDVKHIQRLIVTSATYRQSSAVTPDLTAKDPENRLLARGPRLRLPAEFIRDQALAVSGLLDERIGGPSVSPYQPAGLWEELAYRQDGKNFTAQAYEQSHGKDLYRRTMYTFWKRTSPPPTLVTFDAPDRETCTVRRPRTNTPLQALVLMNDPTYIEASRKLAERMMTEGGASPDERIAFAFRLATARRPRPEETAVLRRIFDAQLDAYRNDTPAAAELLGVGESTRSPGFDASELAAWSVVASTILNLDETVTKG